MDATPSARDEKSFFSKDPYGFPNGNAGHLEVITEFDHRRQSRTWRDGSRKDGIAQDVGDLYV